jgi:hypothetical protein
MVGSAKVVEREILKNWIMEGDYTIEEQEVHRPLGSQWTQRYLTAIVEFKQCNKNNQKSDCLNLQSSQGTLGFI